MTRSLDAPETARILLETAEGGATAAAVMVVGADADPRLLGRRMVRTVGTEEETGGTEEGTDTIGRGTTLGSLGNDALDQRAAALMDEAMADLRARDGLRTVELETATDPAVTVELYLEIRRPVRELVVVGAGHIAQPMAHLGSLLGYRVTVLDDRPDFATRERFPDAHRLVRADFSDPFADVPIHERSHLLLVTRGHKYDYECLVRALRMDPTPAYIGMIGSRRRVRATYVQLLDEGVERALIDRIHAPVGLDIGAETPEEIAVAVAAELVLLARGGTGAPLKDVERVAERFFADRRESRQP